MWPMETGAQESTAWGHSQNPLSPNSQDPTPPLLLPSPHRGWGVFAVTCGRLDSTLLLLLSYSSQDLFLLFPEPSKSASPPRGTGQRLMASVLASALVPDLVAVCLWKVGVHS